MFATPKLFAPEIEKTKQFVRKYHTPIACAATAVATAYVTKSTMLKASKELYYTLGTQHAVTELQRDVLLAFINDKGLDNEVRDYIVAIGNK